MLIRLIHIRVDQNTLQMPLTAIFANLLFFIRFVYDQSSLPFVVHLFVVCCW